MLFYSSDYVIPLLLAYRKVARIDGFTIPNITQIPLPGEFICIELHKATET